MHDDEAEPRRSWSWDHALARMKQGLRFLALPILLVLMGIGIWLLLWTYRLTRAIFLPGNLLLELHVVEVGLLLVLGVDLLVRLAGVLGSARPSLRLPNGRLVLVSGRRVFGREPGPGGGVVDSRTVSARHMEARPGRGCVLVRDLDSANGTLVDGRDIRGRGEVTVPVGGTFELGLAGPALTVEAAPPRRLVPGWFSLAVLLGLLSIGLFLDWRANVERLPVAPLAVPGGAVGFAPFRAGGPMVLLLVAIAVAVLAWRAVQRRTPVGPLTLAAEAIQVLLVLGAVTLGPLLPAEGLRYAEAAARAVEREAAQTGQPTQAARLSRSAGHKSVRPEAAVSLPMARAAVQRPTEGGSPQRPLSRSLSDLAENLAAHQGSSLLRVTYDRQVLGLALVVLLAFVVPAAWPALRKRLARAVTGLSDPLLNGAALTRLPGRLRSVAYRDVAIGVLAAVVVAVTLWTPLGATLGREKKLFLLVPAIGSVQSIELVKALFVLFVAGYFARQGGLLETVPRARYLLPFVLTCALTLAVTAAQADMGGLMMLGLLVGAMFAIGTGAVRLLLVVPLLLGGGLGLAAGLGKASIVATRLGIWLHPRTHPLGEQLASARQLLLSSGWTGYGPSRMLAWHVPDIHGDLIIAAVVERYGFLGLIGLVGCWLTLIACLVALARRAPSRQGALLLGGLAILLLVQVLTQVGGAVGLIPFTGVPLPWLSQGLTASAVFTFLLGLGLAIADGPGAASEGAFGSRLRLLGAVSAYACGAIVVLGLVWTVVLPASGLWGPLGSGYRWTDLKRQREIDTLIAVGVFAGEPGDRRLGVNDRAYQVWRAGSPSDPGKDELRRIAAGLRLVEGQIVPAAYLVTNPNRFADRSLPRGWITARDRTVLAMNDARGRRIYPLGRAFFHPVGVPGGAVAPSGLEGAAAAVLEGQDLPFSTRMRAFSEDIHHGLDVELTVDAALQQQAWAALAGRRGAAVVLDLRDGALLVAASSPAPDPSTLKARDWLNLLDDPRRPLLDRSIATTDYYSPPGSTFKIVMAAAALMAEADFDPGEQVTCNGYDKELRVRCAHGEAHGKVDLAKALTVSCNVYFAHLATQLGPEEIRRAAVSFGFNRASAVELAPGSGFSCPAAESTVNLDPKNIPSMTALARVGYGQGPVSATPLQMARVASAIATGGLLVEPYLVRSISLGHDQPGRARGVVWRRKLSPPSRHRAIPFLVAEQLDRQLRTVLESAKGTGHALPALWSSGGSLRLAHDRPGEGWGRVPVSGKTGSAWKTAHDKTDDSWMVLWGPSGKARVVVCVLVEDAGTGAAVAGPIAMELLRSALSGGHGQE